MKFDYRGYESLLRALLRKHKLVTFPTRSTAAGARFLMRHDIDVGMEFVGEMPHIEKSLGVRATYFIQVASAFYNPFSSDQAKIIVGLLNDGHRIGLHFDGRNEDKDPSRLIDRLEMEADLLERAFGCVDAVSFHQPSPLITSNAVKIAFTNTYDKDDMLGFEYFSDSCQRWSKGDPLELVSKNPDKSFQVLTHPFLWGCGLQDFSQLSLKGILSKAQTLYDYTVEFGRGVDDRLKVAFVKDGN